MALLILVLYATCVLAACGGAYFFLYAASAIHEIEGLLCFLIATVALSGAVLATFLLIAAYDRQRR